MSLVQTAHEAILERAGLPTARRAEDFVPTPRVTDEPVFSIYVDNIIVAGTNSDAVLEWVERARARFEEEQVAIHEFQPPSLDASLLGVR